MVALIKLPWFREQHDISVGINRIALQKMAGNARQARLGAALIERDLLNEKIAILEANRPLARRRLKS